MRTGQPSNRMPLFDCLAALHAARHEAVVVTTMGSAREWKKLGTAATDFVLVPSSMGQATSIGLGIALARPERKVVVCNGDGSMLMNLGSLVTISAHAPANLTVLVLDNGVYEVTGAQPTLAAAPLRTDKAPVDFAAIARACGILHVWRFDTLAPWKSEVADILASSGPSFVHLIVEALPEGGPPGFHGPPPERARSFRETLKCVESDKG